MVYINLQQIVQMCPTRTEVNYILPTNRKCIKKVNNYSYSLRSNPIPIKICLFWPINQYPRRTENSFPWRGWRSNRTQRTNSLQLNRSHGPKMKDVGQSYHVGITLNQQSNQPYKMAGAVTKRAKCKSCARVAARRRIPAQQRLITAQRIDIDAAVITRSEAGGL